MLKNILNNSEYIDHDNSITCLLSFCISWDGKFIRNSLVFPDFIYGLFALSELDFSSNNWDTNYANAQEKLEKLKYLYSESLLDSTLNQDTFEEILGQFFAEIKEIHPTQLKYKSLIHRIKDKSPDKKSKYSENPLTPNQKICEEDLKIDDDDDQPQLTPDLITTPYLNDLKNISKSIDEIGNGLRHYLHGSKNIIHQRYDVRKNKDILKNTLDIKNLPKSTWPEPNDYPLVLAQQFGINTALKEDISIFSINGPPGTGKTTLLKDIIADVLFQRALALSTFDNPEDAFSNRTTAKDDKYVTSWALDKSLHHSIVIASATNGAVENITKEIPDKNKIKGSSHINKHNDYFSFSANILMAPNKNKNSDEKQIIPDNCWGLIAASLGNNANITQFFGSIFATRKGHVNDNLKVILKHCHSDIESYFKNNDFSYEQNMKFNDDFKEWLEFETLKNIKEVKLDWKKEVNNFHNLTSQFNALVNEIAQAPNLSLSLEALKSRLKNINTELENLKLAKLECINFLQNIKSSFKETTALKQQLNAKLEHAYELKNLSDEYQILKTNFESIAFDKENLEKEINSNEAKIICVSHAALNS